MVSQAPVRIAVLGASGLIGEAVTRDLLSAGIDVVAIARRFTTAQQASFAGSLHVSSIVSLSGEALEELLGGFDAVVNCIGVLQDGPKGKTMEVHLAFVQRLLEVLGPARLLVHLSIPDGATPDETPFSMTKRRAETAIRAGSGPFVILRPGFVICEAAYGGSALIRALGAWPFALPRRYADVPFAATDVHDITRAILAVVQGWRNGHHQWAETWDIMEGEAGTVGDVVAAFRRWFGNGRKLLRLPEWLLVLGVGAGDLVSALGWSPPIRRTALLEMGRGVSGNPQRFTEATGVIPQTLAQIMVHRPATVQEKWFSRLYLLKPLIFAVLAVFWCASGLVALFASFDPAVRILTGHGLPDAAARVMTILSSCLDVVVGVLIACRRSTAFGLWTGIAVSLGYVLAATVLAPVMWLDPLGALIKIGPAIVLMGVALAILEER